MMLTDRRSLFLGLVGGALAALGVKAAPRPRVRVVYTDGTGDVHSDWFPVEHTTRIADLNGGGYLVSPHAQRIILRELERGPVPGNVLRTLCGDVRLF